jgi:hypothetical protein
MQKNVSIENPRNRMASSSSAAAAMEVVAPARRAPKREGAIVPQRVQKVKRERTLREGGEHVPRELSEQAKIIEQYYPSERVIGNITDQCPPNTRAFRYPAHKITCRKPEFATYLQARRSYQPCPATRVPDGAICADDTFPRTDAYGIPCCPDPDKATLRSAAAMQRTAAFKRDKFAATLAAVKERDINFVASPGAQKALAASGLTMTASTDYIALVDRAADVSTKAPRPKLHLVFNGSDGHKYMVWTMLREEDGKKTRTLVPLTTRELEVGKLYAEGILSRLALAGEKTQEEKNRYFNMRVLANLVAILKNGVSVGSVLVSDPKGTGKLVWMALWAMMPGTQPLAGNDTLAAAFAEVPLALYYKVKKQKVFVSGNNLEVAVRCQKAFISDNGRFFAVDTDGTLKLPVRMSKTVAENMAMIRMKLSNLLELTAAGLGIAWVFNFYAYAIGMYPVVEQLGTQMGWLKGLSLKMGQNFVIYWADTIANSSATANLAAASENLNTVLTAKWEAAKKKGIVTPDQAQFLAATVMGPASVALGPGLAAFGVAALPKIYKDGKVVPPSFVNKLVMPDHDATVLRSLEQLRGFATDKKLVAQPILLPPPWRELNQGALAAQNKLVDLQKEAKDRVKDTQASYADKRESTRTAREAKAAQRKAAIAAAMQRIKAEGPA